MQQTIHPKQVPGQHPAVIAMRARLESAEARIAELEADYEAACRDADEWRAKAQATETDRIRNLELQIEALKAGPSVSRFA